MSTLSILSWRFYLLSLLAVVGGHAQVNLRCDEEHLQGQLSTFEDIFLYIDEESIEPSSIVGFACNFGWQLTSIPSKFYELTNLEYLYLSGNLLTGTISSEIGNMRQLKHLTVYGNMRGTIPSELGSLEKLEAIDSYGNGFTGSIPTELMNLQELSRLRLSLNGLSGSIPSNIGDLKELEMLDLSGSSLTGEIPSSIWDLQALSTLYLTFNLLSGTISKEVENLQSLEQLDLSYNLLSGNIPRTLGNLPRIWGLYMIHNNLSGKIPQSLESLTQLKSLYLSHNELTGRVPDIFSDMKDLDTLILSHNHFHGKMPYFNATYWDVKPGHDFGFTHNYTTKRILWSLGLLGCVSIAYVLGKRRRTPPMDMPVPMTFSREGLHDAVSGDKQHGSAELITAPVV